VSETHLSPEAYERLTQELEHLTTEGRVEIATAIEQARALGDLSENGDYHAAKDSQGKMESRIRQIQAMLASAVIVEGSAEGIVATGSVLSLRYEGEDEAERYLVGSIEERHSEVAVISPRSPLGLALIGRASGETVQYEAPGGSLRVEIVEIHE
jgi:transcription elongation factor GreA